MSAPNDKAAAIRRLCSSLRPVLDLELSLGNEVDYAAVNGWTHCALSISMKRPLHLVEISRHLGLPSGSITLWENKDPHYAIETGLFCEWNKHAIAGPP